MAKPVKLNLIVDRSCNRLVYAESDGHFVDILLSFLTLPLVSILRLTKQSIGSMNNLLKSVESLDSICFSSEACRSMLLCPSNSASHLLSSLPIQYDNISNLFRFYYTCSSSCSNRHLSFYADAHCPCGGLMDNHLEFAGNAPCSNPHSSVFCNTAVNFAIREELLVSQSSVEFSIEQLSKLDVKQMSSLESVSVDVTAENIVELLKRLLVSDTPLTDVFLRVHKEKCKLQADIQQPLRPKCHETEAPTASSTMKISMKLYVDNDEGILVSEADNDFVDLLFGFLGYPMGAVISKLGGHSGFRCMDNLYNSFEALKSVKCFRNNELIGNLLNPKLPPFFKVKNQLIKLDEETQTQSYFTCSDPNCRYSYMVCNKPCACKSCRPLNLTDPKSGSNDDPSTGGYMRISKYMVTDDLVITRPSSYMLLADIFRKAAGKEIHVRNVEIGEHEALALLRASITSQNVLTDALLGV